MSYLSSLKGHKGHTSTQSHTHTHTHKGRCYCFLLHLAVSLGSGCRMIFLAFHKGFSTGLRLWSWHLSISSKLIKLYCAENCCALNFDIPFAYSMRVLFLRMAGAQVFGTLSLMHVVAIELCYLSF
jgi:hypothetical protein